MKLPFMGRCENPISMEMAFIAILIYVTLGGKHVKAQPSEATKLLKQTKTFSDIPWLQCFGVDADTKENALQLHICRTDSKAPINAIHTIWTDGGTYFYIQLQIEGVATKVILK